MYGQADYEELKKLLKEKLSENRYIHSINVAEQAKKLARIKKSDEEKAYFSGLMHDVCKEMPLEEQEKYVLLSSMNVDIVEIESAPLWHAISGAEFLKEHFNIIDKDILNAVRYHTVGRAEMTVLEKIVYLADLTSADRSYKDVEKIRKICENNLDMGMQEALKFSISDCALKGKAIPKSTFEAYNFYLQY